MVPRRFGRYELALTVAEVEKGAGMRAGFLSPVDGSKLRVTGIAAVTGVLGVESGEIVDEQQPSPSLS